MIRACGLIVLVLALSGCASANGSLVLTEDTVHDSLAKVDDGVRTVCSGAAGALLKPACDDVRRTLIPTLEAGAAFNRCVASQNYGCLAPLIEAAGALVTQLKKLPESETGRLITELGRVLAGAYQRVGGK